MGRWQAQLASASRGKRGQRFFRDLVAALDAMPQKQLIASELETAEGAVCALGALGRHRGLDLKALDLGSDDTDDDGEDSDWDKLTETFGIAQQLARQVMHVNDESWVASAEERWAKVRDWAVRQIRLTPEELQEPGEPG
jgi:hypothetical protein